MKLIRHLKSDWFRYGFETIAVVVGILVAFGLDNWNQSRKADIETFKYLHNIKKDIVADTIAISNMIERGRVMEDRMKDYYGYYEQGDWSIQELADSCKHTGIYLFSYLPINNTYNDMLSSGKSSMLNDQIRNQLAQLKKTQDLMTIISDHLVFDVKTNIHEVEKYWNMEESDFFFSSISQSREIKGVPEAEYLTNDEQSLMQGLRFHHNIFNWTFKTTDMLRIRGNRIIHQSKQIIDQIDSNDPSN